MVEITANMVKKLREKTDVSIMICKKTLLETNGDIVLAEKILKNNQENEVYEVIKPLENHTSDLTYSSCDNTTDIEANRMELDRALTKLGETEFDPFDVRDKWQKQRDLEKTKESQKVFLWVAAGLLFLFLGHPILSVVCITVAIFYGR